MESLAFSFSLSLLLLLLPRLACCSSYPLLNLEYLLHELACLRLALFGSLELTCLDLGELPDAPQLASFLPQPLEVGHLAARALAARSARALAARSARAARVRALALARALAARSARVARSARTLRSARAAGSVRVRATALVLHVCWTRTLAKK